MKFGAYRAFAESGVPVSDIDKLVKHAADPMLSPGGVMKSIVAMSLLTGVPLGIAAHVVGNRITRERGREKELRAQAAYYRNASQQLSRGMAASETAS